MRKNDSDKLHKKFKITNIILAIIAALCVVALIVPMGITVKADVNDSNDVENEKPVENKQPEVINEENIDYEYIQELLIAGKWVAVLTKAELEDPTRGPEHEEIDEKWAELHIYNNAEVCIQECAVVWHVDKTTGKRIRIKYIKLSDANTRGNTLLFRSIKDKTY